MRGVAGWMVVLLCSTAMPRLATADNRAVARAAYAEGSRHYDMGEYQDALASFKRAYLAYEDPSILFNIGQCYRLLGDRPNALQFYRSYLRKTEDAPNRAEVERLIAGLEAPPAAAPPPPPSPPPLVAPPSPSPPPPPSPSPSPSPPPSPSLSPPPSPSLSPSPSPSPPPSASPSASAAVEARPSAPPQRSRAWIAGVVIPVAVVLGVAIGLGAYYGSREPSYTRLDAVTPP